VPSRSKEKGDRRERQIVQLLRDLGLDAARVPLSGAAGGEYTGDLRFIPPCHGGEDSWRAEVKGRANGEGWKTIEAWLGTNDVLFLVRDRAEPLVVLPWDSFKYLLEALGGNSRGVDPPP
jgi:hypothetical protein